MRPTVRTLLLVLAILLPTPLLAQTTVNGVIELLIQDRIVLSSGDGFGRMADAGVLLPGDKEGSWADLHVGDRVRLTLNASRQVVAVAVVGQLIPKRGEISLLDLTPVSGNFNKVLRNVSINGRIFDIAGWWRNGGSIVYANKDGYDLLEAYVGPPDDGRHGTYTYVVLGDGEELFRSPKIGGTDQAHRISVSIKGYRGITLTSIPNESKGYNFTFWADPIFVKLPSAVPSLVSPGIGEKVSQDTQLVWKPVEGAAGYLLELQCELLASPKDADDENRFLMLRLPAKATVYPFQSDKMPKGKWRWRVHALGRTGFIGQMEGWRTFIHE